jgi:hypothetical protein
MGNNSGAMPSSESFRPVHPPIPIAVRESAPDTTRDPNQGTLAESGLNRRCL